MQKLWLIIQREYLTRVKKRSFILATILTPLAFVLFFVIVGFIFAYESDEALNIAILDEGNLLDGSLPDDPTLYFHFEDVSLEELKQTYQSNNYEGILVLPPLRNVRYRNYEIKYYADEQLSLDVVSKIEKRISRGIRRHKIERLKLDEQQIRSLDTKVSLNPEPITETDDDPSSLTSALGAAIGTVMGIIMYMAVFIYGMMVMRSVMEEKTTRIVEVMISSVKPFQLMMGKIIGVGAVGLTQVLIWAILIPLGYLLVTLLFGFDPGQMQDVGGMAPPDFNPDDAEVMILQAMNELGNLNWWLILPLFILYFLGGYFLYASLFAAVGSAMGDDMGESQALTIPITIPVILAFYIMFVAVRAPHSSLSVWSSIFPLFSPIVMPARLAFNLPLWQIGLSVIVLLLTSVFFVWLSARIYRVGILMYGKKVSFKELGKWLFYKE